MSWSQGGIQEEIRHNLEAYSKNIGLQDKEVECLISDLEKMVQEKRKTGDRIFESFKDLVKVGLTALTVIVAMANSSASKKTYLLEVCVIGFVFFFQYCWKDIYENVLTNTGKLDKLQNLYSEIRL